MSKRVIYRRKFGLDSLNCAKNLLALLYIEVFLSLPYCTRPMLRGRLNKPK